MQTHCDFFGKGVDKRGLVQKICDILTLKFKFKIDEKFFEKN
jgi:hypothetical protein